MGGADSPSRRCCDRRADTRIVPMDVVAIAPEQTPTTGPMGRWSWISLGGRIRALDPAAWVGWALTLGLTTAVALLVLNTPLIPALQELAFAPRSPGEPLSAAELDELLADWFAFARVAGVSVVVGVLCARRRVALAAVAVCAAFSRPWRALVPYLLSVVVTVAFNAQYLTALFPDGQGTLGGPGGWWYVFGYSAYSGAAVALSAAIGVGLRSRARSAAARATERRALTIESTVAARAQLARDLHDVVAHHVSLVAVRAESAPYTYPDLGDEARKVLREIATDARSALDELRRVLGVLQRSEGGGPGGRARRRLVRRAGHPGLRPVPSRPGGPDERTPARARGRSARECRTVRSSSW